MLRSVTVCRNIREFNKMSDIIPFIVVDNLNTKPIKIIAHFYSPLLISPEIVSLDILLRFHVYFERIFEILAEKTKSDDCRFDDPLSNPIATSELQNPKTTIRLDY